MLIVIFFYGSLMLQEKNFEFSLYFLIILSLHPKLCEHKSSLVKRLGWVKKCKICLTLKHFCCLEARLMERFSVKLWMNSLTVVLSINKTTGSSFCREIATTVFFPEKFLHHSTERGEWLFLSSSAHTQHTSASLSSVTSFHGGMFFQTS